MSWLRALVDNPVAAKDALVLARLKTSVAVLALTVVVGLAAAACVALVVVGAVDAAAWRNELWPHGRALTASVTIAALIVAALLVPAAASTSIAGERERGTLVLLLTTALTPGRIVAGKLLAFLAGAAPALLVLLPLLAGGALLGDVSALAVLGCALVVVVNVTALAALALGASARSDRLRTASPRALSAAVAFGWGPVVVPSAVLVGVWAAGEVSARALAVAAGSTAMCAFAAVAFGFLVARDALAPSSSPGRLARRPVVSALLVGAPPAGAALLALVPDDDMAKGWVGLVYFCVAQLVALTAIVDVAQARTRRDELSPRRAALAASLQGALGFLAGGALALVIARARGVVDEQLVIGAVAVAAAVVTGLACLTAAVASRVKKPSWRVAVVAVAAVVAWVVPFGLEGVGVPLHVVTKAGAAHPLHLLAIASAGEEFPLVVWNDSAASFLLGLACWAALAGVTLLLARDPRAPRIDRRAL